MPGPSDWERHGKAREVTIALTVAVIASIVTVFVPWYLFPLAFVAFWYSYSSIMGVGIWDGNRGRLLSFITVSFFPLILIAITHSVTLALSWITFFLYWVRIWFY